MKKLLIIRHAKSSWTIDTLNDFDRPLNDRGNHDAPIMAKKVKGAISSIDALITSTANRALSTAKYFAKEFEDTKIIELPELYHASTSTFYKVVETVKDTTNCIAIFSHNPTITDFVNSLTSTVIDDMPTCGVFAIEVNTSSWKNFMKAPKNFLFFFYPKM
jgi:phosphohistidine phosphatase